MTIEVNNMAHVCFKCGDENVVSEWNDKTTSTEYLEVKIFLCKDCTVKEAKKLTEDIITKIEGDDDDIEGGERFIGPLSEFNPEE